MQIFTVLGYVGVVRRPSGSWEVQRGVRRAASKSLPKALWLLGFQTPEARAIAGSIKGEHPSLSATDRSASTRHPVRRRRLAR
jgi:hypothetical protein